VCFVVVVVVVVVIIIIIIIIIISGNFQVIKSRMMIRAMHVTHMGKDGNAYKFSVMNFQGKSCLKELSVDVRIQVLLKGILEKYEGRGCTGHPAQDGEVWRAAVSRVMVHLVLCWFGTTVWYRCHHHSDFIFTVHTATRFVHIY